jgi:hypothetical protein
MKIISESCLCESVEISMRQLNVLLIWLTRCPNNQDNVEGMIGSAALRLAILTCIFYFAVRFILISVFGTLAVSLICSAIVLSSCELFCEPRTLHYIIPKRSNNTKFISFAFLLLVSITLISASFPSENSKLLFVSIGTLAAMHSIRNTNKEPL